LQSVPGQQSESREHPSPSETQHAPTPPSLAEQVALQHCVLSVHAALTGKHVRQVPVPPSGAKQNGVQHWVTLVHISPWPRQLTHVPFEQRPEQQSAPVLQLPSRP
jgi:hypothetical protein